MVNFTNYCEIRKKFQKFLLTQKKTEKEKKQRQSISQRSHIEAQGKHCFQQASDADHNHHNNNNNDNPPFVKTKENVEKNRQNVNLLSHQSH